jgi:hypothetical protein
VDAATTGRKAFRTTHLKISYHKSSKRCAIFILVASHFKGIKWLYETRYSKSTCFILQYREQVAKTLLARRAFVWTHNVEDETGLWKEQVMELLPKYATESDLLR